MLARRCGNIKRWIDFVKKSKYKLAGLKSFARGLMADIVAVENGIKMSWSNGAVEGHVNRIKSIKRQMYGRASFELFRRKVILSRAGQNIPKFDEEPIWPFFANYHQDLKEKKFLENKIIWPKMAFKIFYEKL